MSANVMGIIFSNATDEKFKELTTYETLGVLPFGAKYRLIDFSLSNMHNSDISNVGIIAKDFDQSLTNHIGSGREWDLSRKKNGLLFFHPFSKTTSGYCMNKTEALYGILPYLKKSRLDYVLLSDCNVLCNMDWRRPLDYHISKKADITIIYYMQATNSNPEGETVYGISTDGYVNDIRMNHNITEPAAVDTSMWIIGKNLLISLIEDAVEHEFDCFERDLFQIRLKKYRIAAWEHRGYIRKICSVTDYYKANLDILNPSVYRDLFSRYGKIYTRTSDEVPARYGNSAKVSNSIIGDDCIIEGSVENSILFNGVYIGKGSKVTNCVLMRNYRTGDQVSLSDVLANKNHETVLYSAQTN